LARRTHGTPVGSASTQAFELADGIDFTLVSEAELDAVIAYLAHMVERRPR
jgi:hypothetical protein